MIRYIPNAITYLRLALIPVFVALMVRPTPIMVHMALGVFIFAALTDYVDGLIARRFDVVTDLGKLLDPLADKILVIAALVMLTGVRTDICEEPWVPAWLVVLVLAREIWVTGLRGVAASHGIVLAAAQTGKWKSLLQMVAICCLLLHESSLEVFEYEVTAQVVGLVLLSLSVFLSYSSAIDYSIEVFRKTGSQ